MLRLVVLSQREIDYFNSFCLKGRPSPGRLFFNLSTLYLFNPITINLLFCFFLTPTPSLPLAEGEGVYYGQTAIIAKGREGVLHRTSRHSYHSVYRLFSRLLPFNSSTFQLFNFSTFSPLPVISIFFVFSHSTVNHFHLFRSNACENFHTLLFYFGHCGLSF